MANDFKKYPYQDFNAFNLDWIIERTKEIYVVNEKAEEAMEKAAEARNIASAAANTADTANNTANAASNTANAAQSAASAAQTRADNAYTLADTANTAITNLRSNGTWTPTISRATVSSSSGKWYLIGDVCFLSAKITFASSQTDRGDLFIDGSSIPDAARGKAISGVGAGSLNYNGACTDANNNVWLARGNSRIRATDTNLPGTTILFRLTAVPK